MMILISILAFTFLSTALLTIYLWLRRRYTYWQHKKIPYLKPTIPVGNLKELLLLRVSFGELFQRIYSTPCESDSKVIGFYMFHTPALIIRDPELIRFVLVKNFNTFLNRYEAADAQHDAMGALTLPLAKYPMWRESRKRMSELFTSGQMKQRMYPLMLDIAHKLEKHIEQQHRMKSCSSAANAVIIKVKEMCSLFTTDLTATLFYSIDACSLRYGDSPLRRQTRQLFDTDTLKVLHFMTVFFLPQYARIIRAKVFAKPYAKYMRQLVANILAERSQSKGDLIDKLRLFQQSKPTTHYTHQRDYIASQVGIILLAGFETSASTIAFALYELAKQPALQHRLRSELRNAFATEASTRSLSYETLDALPYLRMVVCETLRLYPAAAFVNRECTPGAEVPQGCSLRPHVDFTMPRGMPAYISVLGIQRDAKYWPDPLRYDPERFSSTRSKRIHPMTYIPFGAGPHGCIGSRLGILQVKLGLVHTLKNWRVETCAETIEHIQFDPKRFMLESVQEIHLRFISDKLVSV